MMGGLVATAQALRRLSRNSVSINARTCVLPGSLPILKVRAAKMRNFGAQFRHLTLLNGTKLLSHSDVLFYFGNFGTAQRHAVNRQAEGVCQAVFYGNRLQELCVRCALHSLNAHAALNSNR